ncbi:MAG: Hsp70 family protein, partial [Arenimonas sp.]|nr:Hsp70 family protein [Arenimonas sp.]
AGKRDQEREAREYRQRLATASRSKGAPLAIPEPVTQSDEALTQQAINTIRRRWLQDQHARETVARDSLASAQFGEVAIDAYIDDPRGRLFQSPKSMIGFKLLPGVREVVQDVLTRILTHIRLGAQLHFGQPVDSAVIGRPVHFKSSMGPAGDEQALDILRDAASAAGFERVDFLYEPEAAALDYHQRSPDRHVVLVVDIGGGTCDLCLAQAGGSEAFAPLQSWGDATGGGDVDYWLNLLRFMGHFGRNVGAFPNHIYSEAAMVSDVVRQAAFKAYSFKDYEPPFRQRLESLQADANTVRLARAAEQLKILLSTQPEVGASLDYIEPGLDVTAAQPDLAAAASFFVQRLDRLLATVQSAPHEPPTRILLTGGGSSAPYVAQAVAERYPGVALVRGEPSLAIVSGLAKAAAG